MTFLAPAFVAMGLAAAAVMVLLHLITRDRPPRAPLPTARFVPGRVERAMTRAVRPADPLLLLVRALALVLAGAAFARPVLETERRAVARIVVLDLSRATGDPAVARDSALGVLAADDALVVFDSSARVVNGSVRDTLIALPVDDTAGARPRGVLSAALIAAQRAAVPLRESADSIELILVSAVAAEELDAATAELRALWAGRVRLVSVAVATETSDRLMPDVRADIADPLGAAAALLDARSARGGARVVREEASPEDSAHARSGGVLVVWPRDPGALAWSVRATPDTVGAVVAGDVVLIAPFERRFDAPDARPAPAVGEPGATPEKAIVGGDTRAPLHPVPGAPGRGTFDVVARWVDGAPAAIERPLGAGCVRDVSVPVDPIGDIALRPALRELLVALSAPCGGRRGLDRVDDATLAMLQGAGPLVDAARMRVDRATATPLVPWLLGVALVLALFEPLVRRVRRA